MSNIYHKAKKAVKEKISAFEEKKESMGKESAAMAGRYGINTGSRNGQIDAFRHAYISAKTTRDHGGIYAQVMGTANELKNSYDAKNKGGNPPQEWQMDEYNNAVGREIGARARAEGWDDDRIALEVQKQMAEGRLILNPDNRQENHRKVDEQYEQRRKLGDPRHPVNNSAEPTLTEKQRRQKEGHLANVVFPNEQPSTVDVFEKLGLSRTVK